MLDRDKKEINELLEMILDSIQVIQERTSKITCGDDFLLSPDNSKNASKKLSFSLDTSSFLSCIEPFEILYENFTELKTRIIQNIMRVNILIC